MLKELLDEMYAWVGDYIKTFYSDDPDVQEKISWKELHTKYVAEISGELAAHLGLNAHDRTLAEIIGLFHDIGRFKQYSVYHTFNDFISENHSLLGLREIRDLALLKRLPEEDLDVFRFAIENHNAMQIAPTENARYILFAKILRDADKLDIYRVLQPTLEPSDGSGYSTLFQEGFLRGEQCNYAEIRTMDDRKLVRLLWIYNIYFGWTMQRIMNRGYVDRIIGCLPDSVLTRKGAARVRAYMEKKARTPDTSDFTGICR